MVNTLCVCIDTGGNVYQSNKYEENLDRITELQPDDVIESLFKPPCSGGGIPVYNASDYLHNFFGFCNAYTDESQRQQTCELEDEIEKLIKVSRKGGKKSSRKSKSRYSSSR